MSVRVETLGGFLVTVVGRPLPESAWTRRKARQLFKCLLSHPRHRISKDAIIEWLWPTSAPEAAAITLRSTLHALRGTLRDAGLAADVDPIRVDRDMVGLAPGADLWVDADELERLVASARTAADPLPLLEEADALYAGEYLPDDRYEDWATERRAALERVWAELQRALAGCRERRGDPDGAAACLQRLLDRDPSDEAVGRELMRLLLRHGRRSEASRVYRRLTRALRDDLGVEPSEATVALGRGLSGAPDHVPTEAVPTRTFLLTDIEGSVPLWEREAEAMSRALARHDALIDDIVARHGGAVVRMHGEGDSRFAAFTRMGPAIAAALELQRAFRCERWPTVTSLRVRMALHTGEASERAGHYYGSAVNRCARLRALAYGGQVLLSEATATLARGALPAGADLVDLGEHWLRGFERPERVFQLFHPDLAAEFPPLSGAKRRSNNLPSPTTVLIGRERAVVDLQALLLRDDVRLVTLTGPGGIGKSRLAVEVAHHLRDRFADGAWLVPLAPIRDPTLVVPTVARVLGVHEAANRPLRDSLADHVRSRRLFLVLDNFEQVLAAAAEVAELLAAAPGLKALVTSRSVLRLSGEHAVGVPPLGLPEASGSSTTEHAERSPAVRLFLERARAARADFAPTGEDAAAVVEICRRVDGLPLAIELAAARVRHLSPSALASRLSRPLSMLVSGAQDLPSRQRTLRDTVAWSYDLLDPAEQRLFRRLAVFLGGCTLGAVEAVCGAAGDLGIDVLEGLSSLVDKSLIGPAGGIEHEPRFMMLETIREYALERLEASGEEAALRRRHAEHFLALAERAAPRIAGAEGPIWLNRLQLEHDNLRAALKWGAETEGAGEIMPRLAAALRDFWRVRGHLSEARQWLDRSLRRVADPAVRVEVLDGAATLAFFQDDYPRASACWSEMAALAKSGGDRAAVATALSGLAYVARLTGDYEQAAALAEESLDLSRQLGDNLTRAQALHACALVAYGQGDLVGAGAAWEESLSLFRAEGRASFVPHVIHCLARVAMARGALAEAAARCEEAIDLFRRRDDKHGLHFCLVSLMRIAQRQGDTERVVTLASDVLTLGNELGLRNAVASAVESLAWVARIRGDPGRAARLFGAAEAIREPLGARPSAAERAEYDAEVPVVRVLLGAEAFAAAWAAGRGMGLDAILSDALQDSSPWHARPEDTELGRHPSSAR